jgi:hypothetical protein
MLVALPFASGSVSANSGVPVAFGFSYRSNVTVPPELAPPDTVALSAIEPPTVADAGCCSVAIVGLAAEMLTDRDACAADEPLQLTVWPVNV